MGDGVGRRARTGGFVLLLAAAWAQAGEVTVSEFEVIGNRLFLTASAVEAAHLDRVAPGARTPLEFRAYDAPAPGLVPVCRFFHAAGAHFYSAFAAECSALQSDPSWIDEGEVFHVAPVSAAGACPAGTAPVYRLLDPWRGDGPAHRYVLLRSQRDALWWQGWTLEGRGVEGVAFCVPVTPDVGHLLRTFANSGWQFLYSTADSSVTYGIVLGEPRATGLAELPEDVPLLFRESEFVRWDPFLGRMVALLNGFEGPVRFVFDYDGGDVVAGCVYEPSDRVNRAEPQGADAGARFRPCRPFTGSRF